MYSKQPRQPFKFRLVMKSGDTVEGGAESKDLCLDHIRQCLRSSIRDNDPVVKGFYLGRDGMANPKEITL